MGTLNERTHSGKSGYEKYILKNDNYNKLKLVIDKKVTSAKVYNIKGVVKRKLKAGEEIGPITSRRLFKVENIENPKKYENGHCLSTSKGYISIFDISKPTVRKDSMEIESGTIVDLNKALIQYAPARLYIKKDLYFDNILGAKKVNGTPKADFIIYGKSDNIFVSHKGGDSPRDFSQIAGLSEKSGIRTKEVIDFLRAVAATAMVNNDKLPYMVYRPINDKDLLNMAVFGPNCKKSIHDENNCNMIAQGNPILENYKEGIKLNWSGHMVYNDDRDIDFFTKGPYQLVFGAFNSAGMHIILEGKKIATNIRTGIYTITKIKTGNTRLI